MGIIKKFIKLYDSGQLRGKTVKTTYNGATHLLYNFTCHGETRVFSRNILTPGRPTVHQDVCEVGCCLNSYIAAILLAIDTKSFVDNNLFH